MTKSTNPRATNNKRNWCIAITIGAAILGVYFFPQEPVVLNEHAYDLTFALYRVCNQRDVAALTGIENRVAEFIAAETITDESAALINNIIASAKTGQWPDAMVACRQALKDQVTYLP